MCLTARQCVQIAVVYEKAAADVMNVPRQQRTAFTRKARWFHMLARIKATKEATVARTPVASDGQGKEYKPRKVQCGYPCSMVRTPPTDTEKFSMMGQYNSEADAHMAMSGMTKCNKK
jgi:hypothetical protein